MTAGKQAFTSPYTVTVKKIEPIAGSNQVLVTFFVTGEDEPAHDFTETGHQVVTAFLNAGMHANVSGVWHGDGARRSRLSRAAMMTLATTIR